MKNLQIKEEYRLLSIISILLKITAVVILIGTLVMMFIAFKSSNHLGGRGNGMFSMFYIAASGLVSAAIVTAFSQLIIVIAQIELNTRKEINTEAEESVQ